MTDLLTQTLPGPTPPTLVTVAGEIDIATVAGLRRHLQALPDRSTVLDLSGVSLLSASGVTEILRLHDRLARADARLVLAAPRPLVRRVLILTELDTVMMLVDTVYDALDLVAADAPRRPPRAKSTDPAVRHTPPLPLPVTVRPEPHVPPTKAGLTAGR